MTGNPMLSVAKIALATVFISFGYTVGGFLHIAIMAGVSPQNRLISPPIKMGKNSTMKGIDILDNV